MSENDVFVLRRCYYEDNETIGVFSSFAVAQEAAKSIKIRPNHVFHIAQFVIDKPRAVVSEWTFENDGVTRADV